MPAWRAWLIRLPRALLKLLCNYTSCFFFDLSFFFPSLLVILLLLIFLHLPFLLLVPHDEDDPLVPDDPRGVDQAGRDIDAVAVGELDVAHRSDRRLCLGLPRVGVASASGFPRLGADRELRPSPLGGGGDDADALVTPFVVRVVLEDVARREVQRLGAREAVEGGKAKGGEKKRRERRF